MEGEAPGTERSWSGRQVIRPWPGTWAPWVLGLVPPTIARRPAPRPASPVAAAHQKYLGSRLGSLERRTHTLSTLQACRMQDPAEPWKCGSAGAWKRGIVETWKCLTRLHRPSAIPRRLPRHDFRTPGQA